MQAFWAKIIAFFMSILAFFGLAKPAPKPETTHDFQPLISSSAVIEKVYCADDGCKEEKKLNFSLPMKDRLKGSYDCSADEFVGTDNGVVFLYDTTDFSGYVDSLQTLGCKVEKNYTMGGDRYALLSHEYFTAYVSFLNANKTSECISAKTAIPRPKTARQ